jgi:hypothetical protein
MQQSQRHEFGSGSIGLLAAALREVLSGLQTADANALVEIESWSPSLLQTLLEAAPEVPVFPQHARSIGPQALGQYVRSRLRCLLESSSDAVAIGSALDGLGHKPLEQVGDDMPGVTIGRLHGRISKARPHSAPLAPSKPQVDIVDVHLGS